MDVRHYAERLGAHVHAFFDGHDAWTRDFREGPIQDVVTGFHVIQLAPGPRTSLWTYVSVGAALARGTPSLEFMCVARQANDSFVELLAMTTYYHATETLGLHHTFPLGRPWLPGSSLEHVLVSKPYPFGPELEVFGHSAEATHILWLLPITLAEREHCKARGAEALESKFDEIGLEYSDVFRPSVV